jgi:hypothetical protein
MAYLVIRPKGDDIRAEDPLSWPHQERPVHSHATQHILRLKVKI